MPHAGEHVIPGAVFVFDWNAPGLSELGCGALLFGLRRWAETGATIGGQSSRGHGVVSVAAHLDCDWSLADAYCAHVESNAEAIRNFVLSLYAKEGAA